MYSLIKEDERMVVFRFSPSVSSPEDKVDGPIKKTSVVSALKFPLKWTKEKIFDRKEKLDLLLQDYKAYTYKQVQAATDCFAHVRRVHEDNLHDLYNGHFRAEKTDALIERLKHQKKSDVDDFFLEELRALRVARPHPNIIKAIGLCRERNHRLVILESMPQGSLYLHLHSQDKFLAWNLRYKISLDLASALCHLHDKHILHRNIKSHNILIASDSKAKLASFMLAKFEDHGTEVEKIAPLEIPKQIEPERIRGGVVTKAFDIYHFGTVLLEIATGLDPSAILDKLCGPSNSGKIKEEHDKRLNEFDQEQMDRLIVAGLRCASPCSQPRPSLKEVYDYLETGNPDLSIPPENVTCNEDHANSSPSQLQELTSVDDVRNGTHPITRKGKEVISECPPRSECMVEQPLVDLESVPGHPFDIGIPPDYNSTGPLQGYQCELMKGFVEALEVKLKESGLLQFEETIEWFKSHTSTLVMLKVPLEKWNLIAQDILQRVKKIEYLTELYREEIQQLPGKLVNVQQEFVELQGTIHDI